MEIPGYKAPYTAKQAASIKYPLQFLCDLVYAVLDDKTGNLLKYCPFMKHPKYKDVWTKSFGTVTLPCHNHRSHIVCSKRNYTM
jgi:hypothetical protein